MFLKLDCKTYMYIYSYDIEMLMSNYYVFRELKKKFTTLPDKYLHDVKMKRPVIIYYNKWVLFVLHHT